MRQHLPRLLIAGVASGVGKTTVSVALIADLRERGLRVQPFKVGPDYLDPSHLSQAAGRPCYNLDTWLLSSERLQQLVTAACSDADLAIIEGMMGLYDGRESQSDSGSAAEIARLLATPVVLVLDANALARSAAAIVLGFQQLDPHVPLAGVIANRVGSEGHVRLLQEAITSATGLPLFGSLPQAARPLIAERHLGLLPASEAGLNGQQLAQLAEQFRQSCDSERLLALAFSAPALPAASTTRRPPAASGAERVRIALARDEAFNFYYPDTLDLLREAGAELVPFSPLHDTQPPEAMAGLYLGGGFPEEHAARLAANTDLRRALAHLLARDLPCYAECGGLMYLCHSIRTAAGTTYPMLGIIERQSLMPAHSGLQLGYRLARAQRDTLLLPRGSQVRGHEFHVSRLDRPPEPTEAAYLLTSPDGVHQQLEGFARGNLLASYLHFSFSGFPQAAQRFVEAARRWQAREHRTG
jgi:cobyrinic acid a,c-diamide synthase